MNSVTTTLKVTPVLNRFMNTGPGLDEHLDNQTVVAPSTRINVQHSRASLLIQVY